MEKIFIVAGSSGNIGAAVTQKLLLESNTSVIGIDIADSPIGTTASNNFSMIKMSVFDSRFSEAIQSVVEEALIGRSAELCGVVTCLTAKDVKVDLGIDLSLNQISEMTTVGLKRDELVRKAWSQYTIEDFSDQFFGNVLSVHKLLTDLSTYLVSANSCSVVTLGSQFAHKNPDQDLFASLGSFVMKPPGYSASKSALENYTRYLSKIFRGTGARFNCLALGALFNNQPEEFVTIYSSQTSIGRMMRIEDVVEVVEFLLSNKSQYINGSTVLADGGWTL